MTIDIRIGTTASSDPNDWSTVASLLSSVSNDVTAARALEWSFEPYSDYKLTGNGDAIGRGLPVVTWVFSALRLEQRENLRDFIPDVTADVYIRTPTNETVAGVRVLKDYACKAKWVQRAEILQDGIDIAMRVEITFTHCVELT